MEQVYYVQFKKVGKKYYFSKNNLELNMMDYCVVETSRGIEVGQVASEVLEIDDAEIIDSLKPILRAATNKDFEDYLENLELAKEAFKISQDLVKKHKLDMKMLSADYTLDKQKIVFYYTAEVRIDFRELLKDLATAFKSRIELRQIGYRDGAKMVGGLGMCGRELCCSKHLTEFDTVSIKMAKNQELSLNPTKITGVCSKLLCCIKYEDELYKELKKDLVKVGQLVDTPNAKSVKVTALNVLKARVTVWENNSLVTYDSSEITLEKKCCDCKKPAVSEESVSSSEVSEEIKALEASETKEVKTKTNFKDKQKTNFKDKPNHKKVNKKQNEQKQTNNVRKMDGLLIIEEGEEEVILEGVVKPKFVKKKPFRKPKKVQDGRSN